MIKLKLFTVLTIINVFFLSTIFPLSIFAQETIRIMTYNILEYPNNDSDEKGLASFRNPYFKTVISSVNPDIIAVQEIKSEVEADNFLTNVLNTFGETYERAPFISNGSDNNVLYYKPSKFASIIASLVNNLGHPTIEFKIYNINTKDTLTIFNTHFSSSSSTDRNTAAGDIRTKTLAFIPGEYFIDIGDHNIEAGTESAFQTLLNQIPLRFFLDPQNLQNESNWSPPNLTEYNTFASRTTKFGGGRGDGLDERFDLILVSKTVNDFGGITLESNSYTEYGNDGLHNNIDINANGSTDLPNQAVSQAVADALYYASDHLPAYADFYFGSPAPGSIVFTQVGADDPDVIEFITLVRMDLTKLKITNSEIDASYNLVNGNGTFDLSGTPWKDIPGGTFVRLGSNLTNENNPFNRIIQYDGTGTNSTVPDLSTGSAGDQLIAYAGSSSDPYFIAGITWGNDGWATSPSNSFRPVTSSDIALGSAFNYYFSGQVNADADATRTAITNTSNWTSYNGHTYTDLTGNIGIGGLPVELAFFAGTLNGNNVELRWRTETEVNNYGFYIERAVENSDWLALGFVEGHGNSNSPKQYTFIDSDIYESGNYYYRLKQTDNDGTFEYSDVVTVTVGVPVLYSLSQNYPNPFNPETRIDYTLPEQQNVSLRVYNILGELVQELINEVKPAGSYTVTFDGSSAAGGLPSGIYVYRIQTEEFAENKKMTLLK